MPRNSSLHSVEEGGSVLVLGVVTFRDGACFCLGLGLGSCGSCGEKSASIGLTQPA